MQERHNLSKEDAVIRSFARQLKTSAALYRAFNNVFRSSFRSDWDILKDNLRKNLPELSRTRPPMPEPLGEINDMVNFMIRLLPEPKSQESASAMAELGRVIFDGSVSLFTGKAFSSKTHMPDPHHDLMFGDLATPSRHEMPMNGLQNELATLGLTGRDYDYVADMIGLMFDNRCAVCAPQNTNDNEYDCY